MAVRELRVFEDPALQKPCREVTEVNDHVRLLLQDLADTMKKFGGTCIAGNQVGVMRRLIVVDTGSGPVKLVNPVIAEQSGEQEYQETCLSFKDIHAIMLRPEKILIYAMDENGEPVGITAEGDEVKHYCHAMDLLDGRSLSNTFSASWTCRWKMNKIEIKNSRPVGRPFFSAGVRNFGRPPVSRRGADSSHPPEKTIYC